MLFEIWSLGKKPYQGLRNEHVSELAEKEPLHMEAIIHSVPARVTLWCTHGCNSTIQVTIFTRHISHL